MFFLFFQNSKKHAYWIPSKSDSVSVCLHAFCLSFHVHLYFSLFTYLQEENVFLKPTYSTFLALLDNYTPSTSVTESQDAAEWVEIDAFLDAILATDVMNHLYNFLVEHGDYHHFQALITTS